MAKWGVALACVVLSSAPLAHAEDVAAAGALFDRGLADMQAGHYEKACPALDESYRLDSRPGTLFTLAECEAKWGHVATAFTHYSDYVARYESMPVDQKVRQQEREHIARRQIAELKPKIPLLTIRIVGAPPAGMTIARDGHDLGQASIGTAIPVDPGDHAIVAALSSGEKREVKVTIALGEQRVVDVEPPAVQETTSVVGTDTRVVVVQDQARSHLGWTIAVGGLALVSLAVGGITGGFALGDKSIVDANCTGTTCNATGMSAVDAGRTMGLVSTIGIITGAVAVVGFVILAVTEPRKHRGIATVEGWRIAW